MTAFNNPDYVEALLERIAAALETIAARLPVPPEAVTPQPDAAGWIEWHGGDCPVPGTMVNVRLRRDTATRKTFKDSDPVDAYTLRWTYDNPDLNEGDIVAYRIATK